MTESIAAREEWRPVSDFPGYEVSNLGRVRRSAPSRTHKTVGKLLSTRGLRNGYPCVDLCREDKKKTFHVHRLVAAAFLGLPPADCPEVNHINADKLDPRAENLEYVSRSGNALHSYRLGCQDARGAKNGKAKLTDAQVLAIVEEARRPDRPSFRAIAAKYGVGAGVVTGIMSGSRWTHVTGISPRYVGVVYLDQIDELVRRFQARYSMVGAHP